MMQLILRETPYRSKCVRLDVVVSEVDIGYIEIDWVEHTNRACVHYSLKKEFWGKGFGARAQDAAEALIKDKGYEVEIAPYMSYRAYRFWLKRDAERVADRSPEEGCDSWSGATNKRLYGR